MLDFIKEQFFGTMLSPPVSSLEGRTVIVTGSNIGLGYAAAVHFAKLSPKLLILAVRDTVKGETAMKKIKEEASIKEEETKLEVWQLDLASFKSVQSFAKRMNDTLDRLDILCENAGVATFDFELTEDGHEKTIQVNDLSTGLLAVLALPLMQKTSTLPNLTSETEFKPHLTIVGSEVHFWAKYSERNATTGSALAALDNKEIWKSGDRYNISKLLNLFLSRKISRLEMAKDVIVNVVNPGLCHSELRREMSWPLANILNRIARTSEVGALNLAWAGTADTSSSPGAYISCCSVKPSSEFSNSKEGLELENKLWDEMVELWRGLEPEVIGKVIG